VKGLSRETRLLLDRGRGETLEPEHRARLKRSVFAGALGASAAATTLTTGWTAAAAKVTAFLIFVGGATAFVAVGTGTRTTPSHAPPAETVVNATPVQAAKHPRTPSTTADPVRVDPQASEPARLGSHEAPQAGTPVTASNAASRASATTGASAHDPEPTISSSLHEEALLVREANASLETGDAARSLALAEEHARRFPNGALLPEGSAVHILALCRAGRLDQARTETDAFLLAHPEGPLSMRVRSSCPKP
jgi:hypothetical protein